MAQAEDVANGAVEERGVKDEGGMKGPVGRVSELGEHDDKGVKGPAGLVGEHGVKPESAELPG